MEFEWRAEDGDTWSDAVVAALRLGGVENLFFVSGSELVFFQEAIAKARARGRPAPTLRTITNEHVALNVALGNAMARNLPAAAAVHVDVGTLHFGAAIHTAWRGGYPVIMIAGTGPRAHPGAAAGRTDSVHWFQEPRDQGGIVRQYTKADHRMEHQDDPGLIVGRLLQLAMSAPQGPVYLSIPMETALLPLPASATPLSLGGFGLPTEPQPNPDAVTQLAGWLVEAESPVVSTASSGRDRRAVDALVALADLLAIPVVEPAHADRLNFPRDHWAWMAHRDMDVVDVLLVLDDEVPYVEAPPSAATKIAWGGLDPVHHRIKTSYFRADLRIMSGVGPLAEALVSEIRPLMTSSVRKRVAARRRRLEDQQRAAASKRSLTVATDRRRGRLTGAVVVDSVARHLAPDSIVVNDGVSNSTAVRQFTRRSVAGTYFRSGGSAGGWGGGASVGIKLADPSRDVVHLTGDGYYLFGCPVASLLAASAHGAPTVTVIFVNGTYSTGTSALERAFPAGYAVRQGDFDGGVIRPEPDYVALSRAGGGHGERVVSVLELDSAIDRAFAVARQGQPSVVAVHVDESRRR